MIVFRLSVTLASVLSVTSAFAQTPTYTPPAARTYAAASDAALAPAAADRRASVVRFLNGRGVAVPASALVEVGTVPAGNGVASVRFEERAGGLTLYGIYAKAAFNARGELVHLIENLVAPDAVTPGRASAAQALAAALRQQYGDAVGLPRQARTDGNTTVFERTAFFHAAPRATRVAFVADDGSLRAGTLVETWSQRGNLLHHTLVGGGGEVVGVELRTNYDSYNVFAIDPAKTVQSPVTGGAGWLGSGSQRTVSISGPNARAYLDTNADNIADAGGTSVSDGNFLTAWAGADAPNTGSNKEVAVQNLFYLNNVMHDTLKVHGFNATAGNFEDTDPVNAEAQDGSGTDNANFSTPADGASPRMQMFLWSNPTENLEVVVNAQSYVGKNAEFGPQLTKAGINGVLAIPSVRDGCSKLSSLTGKVAIIDRGTCSFKKKVANAQAAGAAGVVIANNETGAVFVMGDDTAVRTAIRIPSVFVGQASGATLKSLATSVANLRDRGLTLLMADASLDSDVVYHEYGHGLTWRMIGGMSGPIAGAIGEGASDGVALLMNDGDVIGEYSAGVPEGIRRYPYSVYPLSYGDVTGTEVHDDGEVFAAIVFDMKTRFGTAGLNTLFDYYVDGMNYTPATPKFEDMRDGMLQAVKNQNLASKDADACQIWRSFATFGVGVGARATVSRRGTVSISESFVLPTTCTP
jgi:hypothetical protein